MISLHFFPFGFGFVSWVRVCLFICLFVYLFVCLFVCLFKERDVGRSGTHKLLQADEKQ